MRLSPTVCSFRVDQHCIFFTTAWPEHTCQTSAGPGGVDVKFCCSLLGASF